MDAIITCKNTVYRLNCISIQSNYLSEKKKYYVCIETMNGFYSFTTERDASYLIKHAYNNSMYFETDDVKAVYKNVDMIESKTAETKEELIKILYETKEDKEGETC